MMPKFDAAAIWSNFLGEGMSFDEKPTIFMGVPTMYTKLLAYYDAVLGTNDSKRDFVRATCTYNLRFDM